MSETARAPADVFEKARSHDRFGASAETPSIWLPLVRRIREPFASRWALPGGPLGGAESLEDAARRTLHETTAIEPGCSKRRFASMI